MSTLVSSLSTFVLTLPLTLAAQTIELGHEQALRAVLCKTQERAVAVIDIHAKRGLKKAIKVANGTCVLAQFIGTPILVLATRPMGDKMLKVIQVQVRMADGTTVPWFMPTWQEVKGVIET